jgi:hypothetical protein
MLSYKQKNRKRLIKLLGHIKFDKNPNGWEHVTSMAVGGLLNVGFSKNKTSLLLVISSTGRSIVDCTTGLRVERDYEKYVGLDEYGLTCIGIGVLKDECITISGPHGGGLPQSNSVGESLEIVSPNWPENDLILCRERKCSIIEGHQSYCNIIYTEHLRGVGFSWCGNYIVAACGSDLDIWQRTKKL